MTREARRAELAYLGVGHEAWKGAEVRFRAQIEQQVAEQTRNARLAFFKNVYDEYVKPTRKSDIVAALGITRPTLDRWLAEYVKSVGSEAAADSMQKVEAVSPWHIVAQVGDKTPTGVASYPVLSNGSETYEYEFRNGKHQLLEVGTNDYVDMPEEACFLIEKMEGI